MLWYSEVKINVQLLKKSCHFHGCHLNWMVLVGSYYLGQRIFLGEKLDDFGYSKKNWVKAKLGNFGLV